MNEPRELLDAIAANPADAGAWYVLADWLLENGAPHAVLARYDLQLERGSNDPDLIGDYAAARRERHQLPRFDTLRLEHLEWRCGYLVRLELSVDADVLPSRSPRPTLLDRELEELFALPQLRALSGIELAQSQRTSPLVPTLEAVVPALPAWVNTLTVRGALPKVARELPEVLTRRPANARHLVLSLPEVEVGGQLQRLAGAGWRTIDLTGAQILDPASLARAVQQIGSCELRLGNTGIASSLARQLDAPQVRWARPGTRCAVITGEGQLYALEDGSYLRGVSFVCVPDGWQASSRERVNVPLRDGDEVRGDGGIVFRYVEADDIHQWYRAQLKA